MGMPEKARAAAFQEYARNTVDDAIYAAWDEGCKAAAEIARQHGRFGLAHDIEKLLNKTES